MNTTNSKVKMDYTSPKVERIVLDNEISLVLSSEPPIPGGESLSKSPDYFNNDPFKTNQA